MNILGDIILRFLLLSAFLSLTHDAISQCSISSLYGSEISLEPEDEVVLRLLVSDAIISDLNDPQQGVCMINLEFIHQDVTDLNFTLYNPSGNGVILIGPAEQAGNSLQLFGIAHDLTFLPSTEVAIPDPGMPSVWDNRDPDWGDNSAYAGSYYPFAGDLDVNFSAGSINGIWEIRLIDQFLGSLDPSAFQEFEISFCDQQLTCTVCESRIGEFMTDTLTLCEGQEVSLSDIYPTSLTDDSLYVDISLSFSGDALFSIGEFPDFEGTYKVFILNVLATQEQEVRTLLAGLNKPQLIDLVNAPGGQYCMNLTPDPLVYNVSQNSGITAIIEEDSDVLNCDVSSVTLDASASMTTDSTRFSWFDMNGTPISNNTEIVVNEGGRYTLFISDDVCEDSTSIQILDTSEDLQVQIETAIDTLDCNNFFTTLSYTSNFQAITVNWTNLSGAIVSEADSLVVDAADSYVINLVGQGDCTSSDTISVSQNFEDPELSTAGGTITCDNREITLRVIDPQDQFAYEWFADNVLIREGSTLSIDEGGTYTVVATADNGCTTIEDINVFEDTMTVEANIPSDTMINCFNPVLAIPTGLSETTFISQSIDQGPFDIIDADISISSGGQYRFVVSFENGCFDEYELTVVDNISDTVRLENVTDTLTCAKEVVLLNPDLDPDLYTYSWSSNLSNSSPIDSATVAGDYEVIAEDISSGCLTIQNFIISSDRDDPQEVVSGDTVISCLDSLVTISVMTDLDAEVVWTIPDGLMTQGPIVSSSLTGIYEYVISGSNGCTVTGEWFVGIDQSIPVAELPDEIILNCIDTQVTLVIDTSIYDDASWIYNDVLSKDPELIVDGEGNIILELISDNGCDNRYNLEAIVNRETPQAVIQNSDTTYCVQQSILVRAINLDESRDITYEWFLEDALVSEQSEFLLSDYGVLTMVATDPNTGCFINDEVSLLLADNPILSLMIDVQGESCIGDNNGIIDIAMINGGSMPYSYQINEEPVGQVTQDVSPGVYDIVVTDDDNCIVDSTVTIAEGDNIEVSLPEDRVVAVNETIIVQSNITGEYADLSWFINDMTVNGADEEFEVTIDTDKKVIIQIISPNGCVFRDTMLIDATFTIDQVELYVPNSFTIGDSGPNSSLYLSLPNEILSVDRFEIYDRWGNQVANILNPLGRARVEIWDGTYQNQEVNPGVYVYLCEVTTGLDEQKKVFTGTITLVN